MKYARPGKADFEISRVMMGCWAIAGDKMWGPQNPQDAADAIKASIDAGVTSFDTAPAYGAGSSERLLGDALGPLRQHVIIASKLGSGNMRRSQVIDACEASLRRLRTDYIDIYQVHWPDRNVPFDETAAGLDKLVGQGKVRAVGVSNFGPSDLADFLRACCAEADQVAYNLLFRAAEFELLPVCVRCGVGVLCYSPLAEGLLTGKFSDADGVPAGRARTRHFRKDRAQARHDEDGAEAETFAAIDRIRPVARRLGLPMSQLALAWLLHQPGVTAVIAGARNPQQARENAAAADIELPDDVCRELADATEPVKKKLGPNLDMWQTKSRIR